MSGALFPAAKKGDRVSHDVAAAQRTTEALIGALVGQAMSAVGKTGAMLAQVGAGVATAAHATLSITELIPRLTSGVIDVVSPTVMMAPGLGAAMVQAAPVDCHVHHDKPIAPGTATVLVQGLPLALSSGQTGCGAILCDGAPTVLAGGPAGSGAGTGTEDSSPVRDAVAYADALAGRIGSAVASVERGAALIEQTVTETVTKVEGAVSGAVSAITGGLASLTQGGALGALVGGLLGKHAAPASAAEVEG